MMEFGVGLTSIYNRVHDASERHRGVLRIRELHCELDFSVVTAYGWDDLDLDHGLHETKQGIRFTSSEIARGEVLARLLKLNHMRYAEEVAKGLHEKKGGSKRSATAGRAKRSSMKVPTPTLFGEDD